MSTELHFYCSDIQTSAGNANFMKGLLEVEDCNIYLASRACSFCCNFLVYNSAVTRQHRCVLVSSRPFSFSFVKKYILYHFSSAIVVLHIYTHLSCGRFGSRFIAICEEP